jgi:hypothetical protein
MGGQRSRILDRLDGTRTNQWSISTLRIAGAFELSSQRIRIRQSTSPKNQQKSQGCGEARSSQTAMRLFGRDASFWRIASVAAAQRDVGDWR